MLLWNLYKEIKGEDKNALNKLFVESQQYSNWLKRLLVINNKDCLDPNITKYDEIVRGYDIKALKDKQYIRLTPRLEFPEHEDIKSYVFVSFDNFTTNSENILFRDCMVNFNIICHPNHWELDGLQVRPLMIAGYIDGILNLSKLSGVGKFIFLGCQELVLNQELAGYVLSYQAVHFTEDDAKLEDLSSKWVMDINLLSQD